MPNARHDARHAGLAGHAALLTVTRTCLHEPMSTHPSTAARMTVDEFLRFDRTASEKHEFVDGIVYAMSGASGNHNRIGINITVRLLAAAGDGPCRVYHEGFKLRVGDDFYYPDVVAVCEPGGDDAAMAYAPCVVVEVASPSTRRYDRVEKAAAYQRIPLLRAYLIVEQDVRMVTHLGRDAGGAPWQRAEVIDRGEVALPGPAPGVLTLDEIYRGIITAPPLRRVREPVPASGMGSSA